MNKSYTSIEQSKKLAKILTNKSADNVIVLFGSREGVKTVVMPSETLNTIRTPFSDIKEVINCWSLTALLSLMIYPKLENYVKGIWDLTAFTDETLRTPIEIQDSKDPIDACVEMILKLHELDLV